MRFSLLVPFIFAVVGRASDPNSGAIGIQYRFEEGEVIVLDVVKGSPAEKSGLKKDDVLVKINKVAAESVAAVTDEITRHDPGAKIKITYKRRGKEHSVEVIVGKRSEVLKPRE